MGDGRRLRFYADEIAEKAQRRWRSRCPCCGSPMATPRGLRRRRGALQRNDRTIGHDFPVARGGDERRWVYICWGCNNDQGSLDFMSWSRVLRTDGDRRADAVEALAIFIEETVNELLALSTAAE